MEDADFSDGTVTLSSNKQSTSNFTDNASPEEIQKLKETLSKLVTGNVSKTLASKLTNSLEDVIERNQEITTLQTMSYIPSTKNRKYRRINVQPPSISRRRFGVSRGPARLPPGRPAKKRPRNLSQNIDKNLPNAKSHGAGH